jgi:hypothetical protein
MMLANNRPCFANQFEKERKKNISGIQTVRVLHSEFGGFPASLFITRSATCPSGKEEIL